MFKRLSAALIALTTAIVPAFIASSPAEAALSKKVIAYTVGWDLSGLQRVRENPDVFSNVSPWAYTLNTSGSVILDSSPGAASLISSTELNFYRANGIKVTPAIHNIVNGQWNGGNIVTNMLANTTVRDRHITNIVNLVVNKGYDGIDIDYENLKSTDRSRYTDFLTRLANALHARGKIIATDVYGKTSEPGNWSGQQAQDYYKIGQVVDEVRFMMYDYNPGVNQAQSPWTWMDQTLAFAKTKIPANKIIHGVPMYGYDWASTGNTDKTFTQVQALINQYRPTVQWDATNRQNWFTYSVNGVTHTVRYENAASTQEKLKLVNAHGVAGVHIWRTGNEDPAVWQTFRNSFPR